MCGILGIVANRGEPIGIDRSAMLRMRDTMQARGPDDSGHFQQENVALGHRRLAIRDIEGGTQPWLSDDQKTVLVYNGEIYNDGELRQQLISLGHHFRSRCDTEVVMAAYRQWGNDCVNHFRGMFAFGIYDFREDKLLLARDRFGIKPLFFTEIDGRLIFASSIPALLQHPDFVKAPHLPAISHYLTTFRLTLGRETVYQKIWQLLPGEILEWDHGKIHIEQYWDYPTDEACSLTYNDAVDELHGTLQKSVEMRLASDVPVGMFLSGGVDSNTIASLIRTSRSDRLVGICGGGETEHSDDFVYARRCADHVGFDYNEVRIRAVEYFECWQWMIGQYATPVSTPSDVILYQLGRSIGNSVGVVLGGEGADELLCGYSVQHWAGNDFDRQQQLAAGRWNGDLSSASLFRESLRRQYGRDQFQSPVDHYFALNSLIPTSAKPMLFQPDAWKLAEEDQRMWSYYGTQFDKMDDESTGHRLTQILHRVNLEGLLARLDTSTMLASLEARVPYTDHVLVEKMFQVPRQFRIDVAHTEKKPYLASAELEQRGTLQSKRILRSVAKRMMPASLAHRRKASFPTPVQTWLADPWREQAREQLLSSPFGRELFQPRALQELADNIPQAGMWLWPLLNVCSWGDQQFAA